MHETPDLDPDLRANLDALVHRRPDRQEAVDELLAKRAAGDAMKRIEIEFLLEQMVVPDRRWLFVVIVCTVVAGVVVAIAWSQRRQAEAVASGTPTVAKVLRTEPGDCWEAPKKAVCLRLELELHPAGAAVYTGTLEEPIGVEWMSRVQPGSWLTVSVNPADRSEILFDVQAMAVESPKPPVDVR